MGMFLCKPADIAKKMNEYFLNEVENLTASISNPNIDPCFYIPSNSASYNFSISCVNSQELLNILKSLKRSKSTGLDYIDNFTLFLARYYIFLPLTHLLNLCILKSSFPNSWKTHIVIPLLKKDDPHIPKNCRPVANISSVGKTLE